MMDLIVRAIALCRDGVLPHQGTPGALLLSLFLAALAGSAVHCVGMCGPFVLGQVAADAGKAALKYGIWRRLHGAALVPYHLGRITTYTGLGAIAGGATALFAATSAFKWMSGVLLIVGATFFLLQAFGLTASPLPRTAHMLTRGAAALLTSNRSIARYGLGVVLGFLPCGLIYGALGVAAGTGSPWEGALAMAAFALGTVPALMAVGWGGLIARRTLRNAGGWVFIPILLANAALMLALAGERLASAVSS